MKTSADDAQGDGAAMSRRTMRQLHLWSGVVTLLAFLSSGAYMMFAARLEAHAPGARMLYISRHIYMLGPAFVHLVLAVYVTPLGNSRVRRLQWVGTVLLVVASLLQVAAFVVEPVGGRGRTAVSAFGLYAFWGGALLHVIAPGWARRLDKG